MATWRRPECICTQYVWKDGGCSVVQSDRLWEAFAEAIEFDGL